jgi:hypothetical protein
MTTEWPIGHSFFAFMFCSVSVQTSQDLGMLTIPSISFDLAVSTHRDLPGTARIGSGPSQEAMLFRQQDPAVYSLLLDYPPNIDVVITNHPSSAQKVSAIECKFNEAYSGRIHGGLDPKYLDLPDLWRDIPNLEKLARQISPQDKGFLHLHPAQLLKHILGLKRAHGSRGFRLLYLWYDVLGSEGGTHADEIRQFSEIANEDHVIFQSLRYQELILRLVNSLGPEHQEYVAYLAERYL